MPLGLFGRASCLRVRSTRVRTLTPRASVATSARCRATTTKPQYPSAAASAMPVSTSRNFIKHLSRVAYAHTLVTASWGHSPRAREGHARIQMELRYSMGGLPKQSNARH